jgi:EAL domain-containing protein (putative c-di-GMP-specific phosphodiesterase class I)/GGDEF domain-containing protein
MRTQPQTRILRSPAQLKGRLTLIADRLEGVKHAASRLLSTSPVTLNDTETLSVSRFMQRLRLEAAAQRLPLSYQVKVTLAGGLCALGPALALLTISAGGPWALIGGAVITATGFWLLLRLVRPVSLAADALQACLEDRSTPDLPVAGHDAAGRMLSGVRAVASKLDGLRSRLVNRHPVSGLATREPFLAAIDEDMGADVDSTLLGVVRFADYERLAAFDQEAADRALKAFAERLSAAVSATRPVAHIDRDCFAVWFRGAADPDAAGAELQALAYVLAQELEPLRITPDIATGAALHPHDGADAATLLTRALIATPRSGKAAGGKVAFFTAQSAAAARRRFSLEQDLRHVVAREELSLHYQPVVDVKRGAVVGAEALLRWTHPDHGPISPAEFIPVLERSNLIDEVGLWVLNAACREARSWVDAGLADLKVAVNLSARQVRDPALKSMIVRTLERHRLPAGLLELELTETAAMEDAGHTRKLFGDLLDMGVGVAIDDFGAGYSSLSYLKNLPFSKLKIDREFVEKADERRDSRAICRALVELAEGLGIEVLAEGVETEAEVETLRSVGCPLFQGYVFSRPLDGSTFARTLRDPHWLERLQAISGNPPQPLRRRSRA